jgi:defect-in-organelle-trafficking protein DotB
LFDELLRWSVEQGSSDVTIIPNFPVCHRVHGRWSHATTLPVMRQDIERFVEYVAQNPAALALLTNGKDLDFSYELLVGRGSRKRFRVNATACTSSHGLGVNLVFRSIPSTPPTVAELGLEAELLEHIFHASGLVIIAGTMGSGKTTLLASTLREVRESQPHRFTVSYEFPIEFDLVNIEGAMGPIVQTEIPTHLKSFDHAPVNAARRAVDVLLVGESRDRETFRGICEAAELGTATYTTVHTQSVAETVRRIVNKFPQDERSFILTSLLGNLRLIVYQMLVPRADGKGRVAVREWLPISKSFRREIMSADLAVMDQLFHEEIYRNGQPLIPYAARLLKEGIIDADTFKLVERRHAFESPDSRPERRFERNVVSEGIIQAIIREYARRENLALGPINEDILSSVIREYASVPGGAGNVA